MMAYRTNLIASDRSTNLASLRHHLPDKDLAYFKEGAKYFSDYCETPSAYKNIDLVMAAHDLVEIVYTLKQIYVSRVSEGLMASKSLLCSNPFRTNDVYKNVLR